MATTAKYTRLNSWAALVRLLLKICLPHCLHVRSIRVSSAGCLAMVFVFLFVASASADKQNANISAPSIRNLRLSPDNARIAYTYCTQGECEARIVDIRSGRTQHKLQARDNRYYVDADFVDDHQVAIISGPVGMGLNSNQVGVKNLVTGKYTEITKSESIKRATSVSSNGDILFAETSIKAFEDRGGQTAALSSIKKIAAHDLSVTSITAEEIYGLYSISDTRNGVLISAYGTTNQHWRTLGLWRRSAFFIQQGTAIKALEYSEDLITSASASADGNTIAFAGVVNKRDKKSGNYVYDVFINSNGKILFGRITHDRKYVPEVRISRDGKVVAYQQIDDVSGSRVISVLNMSSQIIQTIQP